MINADAPHMPRGAVVTLANRARDPKHEKAVHEHLAKRLAAVKGLTFLGEYDQAIEYSHPLYFVPSGTIIGTDAARELGLDDETCSVAWCLRGS